MDSVFRHRASSETIASDEVLYICPCMGIMFLMRSNERSLFALGQLMALGIGTFVLALVVLAMNLYSST